MLWQQDKQVLLCLAEGISTRSHGFSSSVAHLSAIKGHECHFVNFFDGFQNFS